MSESKYTPGPWEAHVCCARKGHADSPDAWRVEPSVARSLSRADAKLIAAAPELAEALSLAFGYIDTRAPLGAKASEMALAALRKAGL